MELTGLEFDKTLRHLRERKDKLGGRVARWAVLRAWESAPSTFPLEQGATSHPDNECIKKYVTLHYISHPALPAQGICMHPLPFGADGTSTITRDPFSGWVR